jgi:hypothetical protein
MALRKYVTDREQRKEFQRAERWCEVAPAYVPLQILPPQILIQEDQIIQDQVFLVDSTVNP